MLHSRVPNFDLDPYGKRNPRCDMPLQMNARTAARAIAALLLGACTTPASFARDLDGHLSLYSQGKPLQASEAAEAIVYFRPKLPVATKPLASPATMVTRRKQFVPRIVPITVGSTVLFPNEDPIIHNAFSASPANAFDAGFYGKGTGALHTFAQAGLVKVYCNVHHAMFGHILVLDTPFFARPSADGHFALRGLPDAAGELVVYHDRAPIWRRAIGPASTGFIKIKMGLEQRKVPFHMNKFGKPYGGNAHGYR